MENLHKIQMLILRELIYKPGTKFTQLNSKNVTSDKFAYHLRTLLDLGLVSKSNGRYSLTTKGKEFANRMDLDSVIIEKQPKVSVVIIVEKMFGKTKKYMIQTRLKEPYFGYKGFMTGKIRYGETVFEAGARELKEETGLEADFKYLYTLHEMVYDLDGNILEDKFFNVINAINPVGELMQKVPEGENNWFTKDEFYKISPKYHNEDEIFEWYLAKDFGFKEQKYFIEKF